MKDDVQARLRGRVLLLRLTVIMLLIMVTFKSDLMRIFRVAMESSDWSHVCVVPLLAAELVRRRWGRICETAADGSWWGVAGLVVVFTGLILVTATMPFDYVRLVSPAFFVLAALVAGVGRRAALLLLPGLVLLLSVIPVSERPLDGVTRVLQEASIKTASFLADTLPGLESEVSESHIRVKHGGDVGEVGFVQRRFGARMLSPCFALAWFVVFARPRLWWHLLVLGVIAGPVYFVVNCSRILVCVAVTGYGGFGPADSLPYEISLGWAVVGTFVIVAVVLRLLDRVVVDAADEVGSDE